MDEYKVIMTKLVKAVSQDCEQKKHRQQVSYSTYHSAMTQVCFDCKMVRTQIDIRPETEDKTDTQIMTQGRQGIR